MIRNLKANKILWISIASLSLVAACIGVFNQDVYEKVISYDLLPGTVAQDVITIIASVVLLSLSLKANDTDKKNRSLS